MLRKLLRIQHVVLAVNQQYIASAAQEDAFRTEPRFQLQGSYRNMNKLAEKVVSVMNDRELEALIDDHYAGEAQTLTTGAEANLLKLAELRGKMSGRAEEARWDDDQARLSKRVQAMGGADDDPAVKMIGQLGLVGDRLSEIGRAIEAAKAAALEDTATDEPASDVPDVGARLTEALAPTLGALRDTVEVLGQRPEPSDAGRQDRVAFAELAGTIGDRLDRAIETLGELLAQRPVLPAIPPAMPPAPAVEPVPAPAPAASREPAVDLGPYLDQLGQTMQALVESRPSQVVQSLTPGVLDLFDRLAESIDDDLMPAVKVLEQIRKHHAADDKRIEGHLDRTLRHLDHLRELVLNLRRIDTSRLTPQ